MKILKKYIVITIAASVYAGAIAIFLNPNNLAPGGVSGLAMILERLIPVSISFGQWILILNIPIMAIGMRVFGKRFAFSTVYTLLVSSFLVDALTELSGGRGVSDDLIINALIGGALMGAAMGAIFRMDTTTGGADVVVKVVRQYRPNLKSGQIFLMIDSSVIFLSTIIFRKIELALYAVVAIYVSSVMMNRVLYGADEALLLYIVSEKKEEIKGRLLEEINAGITILNGTGAYTGKNRDVIMCVIHKQSLVKVRKMIKGLDRKSFMVISKAEQVFGEGFQNPNEPEH